MSEELLTYVAAYFGVAVEELKKTSHETVELPSGEEYRIFYGWEDAHSAAVEDCKNLLECEGISYINFAPIGGIENYVQKEWFEDAMQESLEFYMEDIRNEWEDEDTTRLQKEMADAECESEEDYLDYLICGAGNAVDWYIDNFGKKDLNKVVIEKNLADLDKLAEAIVNCDGMAATLATYDGEEICTEHFYAYRTN